MAADAPVLDWNAVPVPPWLLPGVVAVVSLAALALVGLGVARTRAGLRHRRVAAAEELDIHAVMQPYAENVKVVLQMFIGGCLTVVVLLRLLHTVGIGFALPLLTSYVYDRPTLEVVAAALAYSSALELAYALFTRGPDEAVEPLIMGLAAAILAVVSGIAKVDVGNALGVALLVLALAGLFTIKQVFLHEGGRQHQVRSGGHRPAVGDHADGGRPAEAPAERPT